MGAVGFQCIPKRFPREVVLCVYNQNQIPEYIKTLEDTSIICLFLLTNEQRCNYNVCRGASSSRHDAFAINASAMITCHHTIHWLQLIMYNSAVTDVSIIMHSQLFIYWCLI